MADKDIMFGEIDTPHKKMKKKKKKIVRSDHKHVYAPCTFYWTCPENWGGLRCKKRTIYAIGSYCTICGRIGDSHILWNGEWTDDFDGLPQFELNDFLDKFVTIIKE